MNAIYRLKSYLLIIVSLFVTVLLLSQDQNQNLSSIFPHSVIRFGGLERADTTKKEIYLVFTGGDYNDGGNQIKRTLKSENVKAHFFFTGDFYRNRENRKLIKQLIRQGHYLGPHSDKHLLYASWENRDSLLVSKDSFLLDLSHNYKVMKAFGITKKQSPFFIPPYEWYNQQISRWAAESGTFLINYTPGTRSNADYTTPDMEDRYLTSEKIFNSIIHYERNSTSGLNGFILLLHIGTHPNRTDKLYTRLGELIQTLRELGYQFELLPMLWK